MGTTALLGLLVLLGAGASPTWAATPEAAIRTAIAARLSMAEADVEVSDLTLPAGAPLDGDYRVVLPGYRIHGGHVPVGLELRAASGGGSWRVRPAVRFYGLVPVAATEARAGEPVPIKLERLPLDVLRGGEPADATLPWEARVTVEAGEPLTSSLVRLVPDVREGTIVRVVVRRGGLEVRCDAQLQADARYGDAVPVLNLVTRARLAGVLQTDGSVLLGGS